MSHRALLVEDDTSSLEAMERLVQGHGFDTVTASSVTSAKQRIDQEAPDLAILDLELPDGDGAELLDPLRSGFDTQILIVTGHGSIDSAVSALHSGVADYLTKPVDPERLDQILSDAKRRLDLRGELNELRDGMRQEGRFGQMIGSCPAMQQVYALVSRVARTTSTVLLTGETGTGKDLIAQTIHRMSPRANKPFIAVNCGAIQPTLIESELFGHESGAFTGASKLRRGVFEQAKGGTLFLDEVTEMPLDLQVKLLRVLQTRVIRRVGAEKSTDVDVRLIAATNRSPEEAVRENELREDLFYRLNVFPIHVPPLRERKADIDLLATYFLSELNEGTDESKSFDPEALDRLHEYGWQGNVRELRNVIERAFILAETRITAEQVQIEGTPGSVCTGSVVSIKLGTSIAMAEKQLIVASLEHFGGDKKRIAEILGISMKTLYNRLNSYGLGRRSKDTRP